MSILVVIPATSNHKPVVEISIERLMRRFPQATFLVVCPSPDAFTNLRDNNVCIAADDEFAPVIRPILAAALSPAKTHLVGWYYQQFLKYAVVAKAREARVLVVDADTIVMRDIQHRPSAFFTSKERHEPYFEHFRRLFGETAPFKASAITNFMWFSPDTLREMLFEIQERHNNTWWKVIVDIANNISADGAFSEYETYANWFSLRNGHHTEVPITIFRRGDLLARSASDFARVVGEVEAKGYDAVAFELNHRGGVLRRLGGRMVLKLAIKLW